MRGGQIGQGCTRHERGADDVGGERALPRRHVQIFNATEDPDPGGVHDCIDATKCPCSLVDRAPDGRLVRDVAGNRYRARSGFLRRIGQQILTARQQRDLVTRFGEAYPDAPAKAGSRRQRSPFSSPTSLSDSISTSI